MSTTQGKEVEIGHKKSDLEKQLEVAEAETLTVRNELKIALKRIEDLQAAISGDIDSDNISDQVDLLEYKYNNYHQVLMHYFGTFNLE